MAENQPPPGPGAGFAADFVQSWKQLPNKGFFFALLAAWLALFQFLGNATFGYINSASLFQWMSVSYQGDHYADGHGFLIPLVVLVLFWLKREQLLVVTHRLWWPALILLGAALVLHVLGYIIQQPKVSIVALFCGIYALMGLAWGPAWMRASLFPFVLFVFCVPISTFGEPVSSITFYLRLLVSKLVVFICNVVLGMNIIREGTQLYNSAHTFTYEVAAACSGLRSLVSIFVFSTIFVFINFEKNWKRVLVVAAAFPLAVIGNTLRMLLIVVVAELDGQSTGNFVHENTFFSLLPYVPVFVGLILLGHWLREQTEKPPSSPTPAPV